MGWNHRILAHEHNGEVYLQIHEVYYDENDVPNAYTERAVPVSGDSLKSITWILNKMLECRNKPILWAGEKFPSECKMRYTCDLCGRNKFTAPTPHKCKGGFRKRGLRWSLSFD